MERGHSVQRSGPRRIECPVGGAYCHAEGDCSFQDKDTRPEGKGRVSRLALYLLAFTMLSRRK